MSKVWHILGVGSIGGLFAHRLHRGGATVRLITRSAGAARRSIVLKSDGGDQVMTFRCSTIDDKDDISHLLITSKSWAAGSALSGIRNRIGAHTTIVAMMNGMQHIDEIYEVAPESDLFFATTTAGCHRTGEHWTIAGEGKTLIGHPHSKTPPTWFATWQGGIPSLEWCTDINERLVEKVAINACINPLTAIHGVKNGALLGEPYLAQSEQIIGEVSDVLIELGYSKLAAELGYKVRSVILDTSENTSSMLSDVIAERRTEVDSILGWLLDQTQQIRPNLSALLSEVRSMEPAS